MTTEKDIIWVWDTEYDKKQAEQLEKRVKQKIIEEIRKFLKGFDWFLEDGEEWGITKERFREELLKSLGEKNNDN